MTFGLLRGAVSWHARQAHDEVHGDYSHWQGLRGTNRLVIADDWVAVGRIEVTLGAVVDEIADLVQFAVH